LPLPAIFSSAPTRRGEPKAFLRRLEAVKAGVRIEVVAGEYGEFKLVGSGRLLGRCVSPAHEDRTPSMYVYPEDQHFHCYGIGCGARGDVLDLVMLAEGCALWEAMMILSTRYGIELPGRPESWFAKQERQKSLRDRIDRERFEYLRRRLFRRFFKAPVMAVEDLEEREAEYRILWDASDDLARLMLDELDERRGS
jgi:DNA primase